MSEIIKEIGEDGKRVYRESNNGEKIGIYTEYLSDRLHYIVDPFNSLTDLVMMADSEADPADIYCMLKVLTRDVNARVDELCNFIEEDFGEIRIDCAMGRYSGKDMLGIVFKPQSRFIYEPPEDLKAKEV